MIKVTITKITIMIEEYIYGSTFLFNPYVNLVLINRIPLPQSDCLQTSCSIEMKTS